MKTLVLVGGYARAGKDTLCHGMLEWSKRPSAKVNFADALKQACNTYLADLGLPGDFMDDDFKVTHREFLVAAGRFARAVDRDVFARHLAKWVPMIRCNDGTRDVDAETVVCSDWRYLNELEVCRRMLPDWRIRTVYVATSCLAPANDEEAWSIDQILTAGVVDQIYVFKPNQRHVIIDEGRRLALTWNL